MQLLCSRPRGMRPALAGLLIVCAWLIVNAVHAASALADGPGNGTPWVVTVGDSYISGEAGRWAGNTNNSSSEIDALGPTAYDDNASDTAETIPGCHRSHSDEAYIGGGVSGEDLACSGAETSSYTDSGDFKPGLDFYNSGGNEGQALQLQQFAATHNVKLVLVTIGGNNYDFSGIVQDCIEDFLASPSWWADYCSTDSSTTKEFTAANVSAVTGQIKTGLLNVGQAMANAGYSSSQWKLLAQNYPSPIPNGSGFRYSQSGYTRQNTGGCGFWNTDANWANATALPTINNSLYTALAQTGLTNTGQLNISSAFNGHRLCESGVGLLEEEGLSSWTQPGAAAKSEWINQVRTVSTLGSGSPYELQEDLHPNYWGQLALRNCVRQAYNSGAPKGGTCTNTAGTDAQGEPNMVLR